MMKDQIRSYFREVEAFQGQIVPSEVAEMIERVVELPVESSRVRTRPRPWVAVAVAAAVFLVLGVSSVLLSGSEADSPPATSVTTTTVTTEPVVPTELSVLGVDWATVTFSEGAGPQSGTVVRGTNQFVVLQPGYELLDQDTLAWVDTNGDTRNILWTSPDAVEWSGFELTNIEGRPLLLAEVDGTYVMQATIDGVFGHFLVRIDSGEMSWTQLDMWVNSAVATRSAVVMFSGPPEDGIVVATRDFSSTQVVDWPVPSSVDIDQIVATDNRFYALTYSSDSGRSAVWSSADGIEWREELGEDDLPQNPSDSEGREVAEQYSGQIASSRDAVLVYIDRGRAGGPFWMAESGGSLVHVGGPANPGEVSITASDAGFFVEFTDGFGDGELTFTGPFTTIDGSTWYRLDGPEGRLFGQRASVGDVMLSANGTWEVTFNEEGDVAGEGQVADGTYTVGRLTLDAIPFEEGPIVGL